MQTVVGLPVEDARRRPGMARSFSITSGPFLRVLATLRLLRSDHTPRATILVMIAWVPMVVTGLAEYATGHRIPNVLLDISVHVRILIGIPLLVQAGRMLERRCSGSVAQLYRGGFADFAAIDPIVARAQRLRSSRLVEIGILLAVVIAGQAIVWGFSGRTGVFSGVDDARSLTFAHIWYVAIALPIAQFLYFDWLWQWLVWSYVVVRVSRLKLNTIATHPDRAAGLGFLSSPLSAFAGFVLAATTMVSAAWCTQIIDHGIAPQAYITPFILIVIAAGVIAIAPLLVYMPLMYRARHRDARRYNELALSYVRDFDRKWVDARPVEQLLGTTDIQSLNDMIGAVGHVEKVRLVPFGPRSLMLIWFAAVIPMLPLIALAMPMDKLLEKIAAALLAGIPG